MFTQQMSLSCHVLDKQRHLPQQKKICLTTSDPWVFLAFFSSGSGEAPLFRCWSICFFLIRFSSIFCFLTNFSWGLKMLSFFMPTVKHFCKRHRWQKRRVTWFTSQLSSKGHRSSCNNAVKKVRKTSDVKPFSPKRSGGRRPCSSRRSWRRSWSQGPCRRTRRRPWSWRARRPPFWRRSSVRPSSSSFTQQTHAFIFKKKGVQRSNKRSVSRLCFSTDKTVSFRRQEVFLIRMFSFERNCFKKKKRGGKIRSEFSGNWHAIFSVKEGVSTLEYKKGRTPTHWMMFRSVFRQCFVLCDRTADDDGLCGL